MSEVTTNISNRIDELEAAMLKDHPQVNCPVTHSFVPGYYIRTIEMPAGTLITSRIHKTEHPFRVSKGVAYVKINDEDWDEIEAPFWGLTQPGTRRVLYIESTCTWTTFHATDIVPENDSEEAKLKAVELVADEIIDKHINPLVGGVLINNIVNNLIND